MSNQMIGGAFGGMELWRVRVGFQIRKGEQKVNLTRPELEVLAWLITEEWPQLKKFL